MRFHLLLIFTLLLSLIPAQAIAADEIVEKTECVQAFGYADLDSLKADLLLRAKRLAVDDLFGFLIVSSTAVQMSVLTNDDISTSSVGYVRVKGIPDYVHGDSLAEVCVTMQAYVTEKDRMKFSPITIAADECVTQPDLSPRKLEDLGEEQTIIKALLKMNAKLQDQDRVNLLKLVRNVKFAQDSGIIPNTDTYCGKVTLDVVPIEIEAFLVAASLTPVMSESGLSAEKSSTGQAPAITPTETPIPVVFEQTIEKVKYKLVEVKYESGNTIVTIVARNEGPNINTYLCSNNDWVYCRAFDNDGNLYDGQIHNRVWEGVMLPSGAPFRFSVVFPGELKNIAALEIPVSPGRLKFNNVPVPYSTAPQ